MGWFSRKETKPKELPVSLLIEDDLMTRAEKIIAAIELPNNLKTLFGDYKITVYRVLQGYEKLDKDAKDALLKSYIERDKEKEKIKK